MTPQCPDDDLFACINGEVYGPCEHPDCGGVCTTNGKCQCEGCDKEDCCHKKSTP